MLIHRDFADIISLNKGTHALKSMVFAKSSSIPKKLHRCLLRQREIRYVVLGVCVSVEACQVRRCRRRRRRRVQATSCVRRVRLLYPIREKFRRRCVALGLFFQLFCFFVLLWGAYRTFLSEGSPSGGLLFSLLSFSVSVFGGLDQPLIATTWSCHLFEILIPF